MAAPVALPSQFGRYRILQSLGSGGMGAVYLAEDTVLSRKVAIKVPHFTADDGPHVRERFLREGRAAAVIDHPNLCPIHDIGECDGIQFMVMPFIEGQPLSRLVDRDHPWPPGQAVALVKKLAAAVQVLHERGLIHRDLKPANVMIRANGEPVIMDFGLAKSLRNEGRPLTQLGAVMGTPAYMPPEQVLGDLKLLGPASDVYSLGVIFYELLTGVKPFEGPPTLVCAQILQSDPELPSVRRPGLSPWLDSVCMKAMAKRLGDRFATMTDFARALELPLQASAILPANLGALPTSASPAAQATQQVPTPSSAAVSITCPKCGTNLKVPPSIVGKKLLCPRCQTNLKPVEPALNETAPLATFPDFRQRSQPTPKSPLKKGLAAILALLICLPFGWLMFGPKGESKTKPSEQNDGTRKNSDQISPEMTNSINMTFVRIPAGKFMMGSPKDEIRRGEHETQHEVEITRPFYLGVYEVTQGQYEQIIGSNPSYFSVKGGGQGKVKGMKTQRFPVENVSWNDAVRFCEKLSASEVEKKAGRSYRLPTEAEWEYACRGGAATSQSFHFGDSLSSRQANMNGNLPYGATPKSVFLQRTCEVGSYKPNGFGLFDMHGNVFEWCQDWYGPYDNTIVKDPKGLANSPEKRRILRGGSWESDGRDSRTAYRAWYDHADSSNSSGFRVLCIVRTP